MLKYCHGKLFLKFEQVQEGQRILWNILFIKKPPGKRRWGNPGGCWSTLAVMHEMLDYLDDCINRCICRIHLYRIISLY